MSSSVTRSSAASLSPCCTGRAKESAQSCTEVEGGGDEPKFCTPSIRDSPHARPARSAGAPHRPPTGGIFPMEQCELNRATRYDDRSTSSHPCLAWRGRRQKGIVGRDAQPAPA